MNTIIIIALSVMLVITSIILTKDEQEIRRLKQELFLVTMLKDLYKTVLVSTEELKDDEEENEV